MTTGEVVTTGVTDAVSSGDGSTTRLDEPIVVGAGPGGLAAAYALKSVGRDPLLLERMDRVCSRWPGHYDGLHLNSPRWMSSLPGMPMERDLGAWVSKEDFIAYVERYAGWVSPRIEFGTEVGSISREDGGWRVETSAGPLWSSHAVVATGLNARPYVPDWPGRDGFEGELVHAVDYRNPAQFEGREVLVVGVGATGTDVVMELARGGTAPLSLSVRTPPLIFRRHVSAAILTQAIKHARLPRVMVDVGSLMLHRMLWGDLTEIGLGRPSEGLGTSLRDRGHGATIDRGLVNAARKGCVEIVPAVERFEGPDVILADGRRVRPDVVLAATGQRTNLQDLVGHLGVLLPSGRPRHHGGETAPGAEGLHFLGYRIPPGQLPDLGIDARAIARRVAATAPRSKGAATAGAVNGSARAARPIARPRYKPSATAEVNCAERAAEDLQHEDRRLFHDPFAKYFLQTPHYKLLCSSRPLAWLTLRVFDNRFPGLHAEIVLRYHLYARELARALDEGIDQVVLLGAGYDSTSLRLDLGQATLYEVDAPPTQQAKRRALARHGLEPRNEVVYVPCDFEVQQASTRLAESGFDASRPSFVLWYGVLFYLSEEAVRGTMADIARLTAPGSRFLFDYLDATVVDGTSRYPGAQRARKAVQRRGEPYTFGLSRETATALADEAGFSVYDHVRVRDLCRRYRPPAGTWCSDDDYFGVVATQRTPGTRA